MAREYDIAKVSGLCAGCGRELEGGEEFVAALHDRGAEFRREDFCLECWAGREDRPPRAFSVWRGRVPLPQESRSPPVPEEVLTDFFEKLAAHEEPSKVNVRFVLALMLMRRKLLVYDGSETDQSGRSVWTMHFRSDPAPVRVVQPELDEQQIAEVGAQLGAIFEVPT